MITIQRETSTTTDLELLVQELDLELNERYGLEQNSLNQHNSLTGINKLVILYIETHPNACGCFKKLYIDSIEIKRMFVKQPNRGSGIAKMVLQELEKWAIEEGFKKSFLETGIKQPEAIAFYKKSGYTIIDNYGPYIGNINSVCMNKELQS